MKIVEFREEKQGRPINPPAKSTDGRGLGIPYYSVRGVHLAGEYSRANKTDNYSAGNEMVILVDASDSAITITLPSASTNQSKVYYIKKTDSSINSVIIEGNDTLETIDGEEEISLTLQYQYVTVICDGSNWYIIGGEHVKMDDILLRILDELKESNSKLEKIQEATDDIVS